MGKEPLFHIRIGVRVLPVYQEDVDRFDQYLTPSGRWIGGASAGYGGFRVRDRRERKSIPVRAHVFQWARHHKTLIPEGYEIDHIDFDRLNLRIDNLRCIPKSVNAGAHAPGVSEKISRIFQRIGAASAGENHGKHVLTDAQVESIRMKVRAGATQRQVAREFRISYQYVSRIIAGRARARGTPIEEVSLASD